MANWSPEQMANARLIMAVGTEMKMSSRDILTAIMTAMQESSLRNLGGGDRDSVGLFQQRPSQGWGSYAEVSNPLYATKKFFTTLKGIGNRGSMQMWQAAQAVQRSANPFAYEKWENDARRLMNGSGLSGGLPFPLNTPPVSIADQIGTGSAEKATQGSTASMPGVSATTEDKAAPGSPGLASSITDIQAPQQPAPPVDPADASALAGIFPSVTKLATGGRQIILNAAQSMLGTPYEWGGGNASGPTYNSAHGRAGIGLDCSGLVLYAYAKAGIKLPHFAASQVGFGKEVPVGQLQPGDLVGFGNDVHHIAIYIGGDQIIEAPYTGSKVRISSLKGRKDARGFAMPVSGVDPTNYEGASSSGEVMTQAQKDALAAVDSANPMAPMTPDPEGVGAPQESASVLNFPGLTNNG